MGDAALGGQLVESGIERVETFSMDRLADLYLEIYERVTVAAPQAKGWRRLRNGSTR